jgi:hypothetical protein
MPASIFKHGRRERPHTTKPHNDPHQTLGSSPMSSDVQPRTEPEENISATCAGVAMSAKFPQEEREHRTGATTEADIKVAPAGVCTSRKRPREGGEQGSHMDSPREAVPHESTRAGDIVKAGGLNSGNLAIGEKCESCPASHGMFDGTEGLRGCVKSYNIGVKVLQESRGQFVVQCSVAPATTDAMSLHFSGIMAEIKAAMSRR